MDKKEVFNTTITFGGTLLTCLFGGWDLVLQVLVIFMVLDYTMGFMCGTKEKNLSSQIGFDGLKKKFTILIILILAVSLDRLLGQGWIFRTLVIWFYIGIEGLSILENAVRLGVPFPEQLKDVLVQLKKGNKKEIKKEQQ
ncbi:phage holin family protein [Clostridium sp. MB40-C1]|uniref:phage holin family protein n=1 Tax=Clostridium sp. MB40-C1 TaxID=3070996 RepID=UPI0027E07471|nr:phage holin family protein [Clostridium sp. MB40-C1]WMJ79521.1 phage holin family protein [Clostridium sp. MB40-C1]